LPFIVHKTGKIEAAVTDQ